MAEDRKTASTAKRGNAPVTWHPLFPAMLAVWFGALFGLGILAIRAGLLEAAVLSLGLDSVIPAAAPPLGTTARILLAFGFALLGGTIGAAIGLLMARSRPDNLARRAEAAAARQAAREAAREIKAAEAETLPAQPVAGTGEMPGFIDISRLDLDDELRIEPEIQADLAPEIEIPEIEIISAEAPEPETELKPARAFERPLDPVSFPLPESFPVPGGAAAARLTSASLDSLSHLELIERLALSLQKRREEAAAPAEEEFGEPLSADASPAAAPARSTPSYYPPVSEAAAERGYASLRGLSRPPVQDEEADTSIARFPEPGPRPSSEATERALRDALATLQRMSGAA